MTLVVRLLPPLQRMAAYQQRWMAALLLLFLLVLGIATKLDRFQNKRSETSGFRVFALRKPLTAQIKDLRRSAMRQS